MYIAPHVHCSLIKWILPFRFRTSDGQLREEFGILEKSRNDKELKVRSFHSYLGSEKKIIEEKTNPTSIKTTTVSPPDITITTILPNISDLILPEIGSGVIATLAGGGLG